MLVKDVMTRDLVTCPVEASLRLGVERMLANRVGSVIVSDGTRPVGIVTETDVLHAGYVARRPFAEIPVRKVMSGSLVTIGPEKTLRRATRCMHDEGVKKLVVVEDFTPVGIVTTRDVIDSYHDLKAEMRDLLRPDRSRIHDPAAYDFDGE